MIACIAMGIPRPQRLALGQGLLKVRDVAEDGIGGPRHRGPFHGGVQEEPLAVATGLQGFLQQTDLRCLVQNVWGTFYNYTFQIFVFYSRYVLECIPKNIGWLPKPIKSRNGSMVQPWFNPPETS